MLIRVTCLSLILSGAVIMFMSARIYSVLSHRISEAIEMKGFGALLFNRSSQFIMWIFVVGYLVGAADVIFNDNVQPIYYFVSGIFFLGAIFVFCIVQSQQSTIDALETKDDERLHALEIAELRNMQLREQVEDQLREVQHQGRLLRTVNEVASILLASNVDEFEKMLELCMGMLADSVNVTKVGIWQNCTVNGALCCTLVHEWTADGIVPQKGKALTTEKSYDETIPGWEKTLEAGKNLNAIVKNLSQAEQAQLSQLGIRSILVMPVFLREQFWGFLDFDDCRNERTFTESEEGILQSGNLLLANALMHNETTKSLVQAREEALSSNKAKGEFLANMSHEIRTPINAITGMAAVARGTDDIERIRYCLDKMDAASTQLLGIINDILDMSKIEANKMQLASEPFELRKTIQNVESIVEMRVSEKKQNLAVSIADDVPEAVIGDDMRLSQILLNLLSNAVKFTPDGGHIKMSLRLVATRDNIHWLEADVEDDGIGISEEQQKRLFQSFEQADNSTSKIYGGSGLGLAISQRIAALMDGGITLKSKLNEGSCFTVRFCLRAGKISDIAGNTREASDYDLTGRTALLAEDIPVNQEIVKFLLEEYGMKIECASNGQEAVDYFLAGTKRYDIIFMDIHMPMMDGYTATQLIRDSDAPDAKTVPILAMTANAFAEDVARCREAGMNDHIAKPIDPDLLLEKIVDLIGRSQPESCGD